MKKPKIGAGPCQDGGNPKEFVPGKIMTFSNLTE
jgi:hypothetical protein